MVVWTGYGLLTVLIAFVLGAVGEGVVQPALRGVAAGFPSGTGLAIGLVVAAVVNWLVGTLLNRHPGREPIDPRTGQPVVLRQRHTLLFIPMQFWSVVLLVAGIVCIIVPSRNVELPVSGKLPVSSTTAP